jgi:hypothetical protein
MINQYFSILTIKVASAGCPEIATVVGLQDLHHLSEPLPQQQQTSDRNIPVTGSQ